MGRRRSSNSLNALLREQTSKNTKQRKLSELPSWFFQKVSSTPREYTLCCQFSFAKCAMADSSSSRLNATARKHRFGPVADKCSVNFVRNGRPRAAKIIPHTFPRFALAPSSAERPFCVVCSSSTTADDGTDRRRILNPAFTIVVPSIA